MTPATALSVTVPSLAFGPVYVVHIAVAYLAVAAGIFLLLQLGFRVSAIYQKQVALLVTGALPPFASHLAFTLGRSPVPHLDLTPFAFAFTGVVFSFALFRFDLLDLAPVARERSFEKMGDGLVVVDAGGRVADFFGVADRVFEGSPAVGDPVARIVPSGDLAAVDDTYRTVDVEGHTRIFHVRMSPLLDDRGMEAGQILTVRDVTDLRRSEHRLAVSNRVLRHNLRNDMNVVLGYAEELEGRLSGRDLADARRIRETAAELMETSEKARLVSELGDVDGNPTARVDAVDRLETLVATFRETHPTATMQVDLPRTAWVRAASPRTFHVAVENVLENAVEHADGSTPQITARVRTVPDRTRVEMTDDGSGIPEMETRVFDTGKETPLRHSQGIGLWLAF